MAQDHISSTFSSAFRSALNANTDEEGVIADFQKAIREVVRDELSNFDYKQAVLQLIEDKHIQEAIKKAAR